MKAISFLGPTNYQPTTYRYRGTDAPTRFFSAALPHFFPDLESVLVFVTPTVQHHTNFEALHEELGPRLKPVSIPEGHSEQDLWTIFDRLTGEVKGGERVIFDITNSFRSLPFLCFLAAAYVRTALDVQVEAVLYGAYEARVDNVSPVFDLTSFIGLLDWTTASDQFIQTGDARRLAALLNSSGAKKGAAFAASNTLSAVSLAAFLCQPFPLMSEAQQLEERLTAAENQLEAHARPYRTLHRQIIDEFGSLGATADADPLAKLQAQLRMIIWYQHNNQLIQAVTLAREWLISAVTHRLGEPIRLDKKSREAMEWAVSGIGRIGRKDRLATGEEIVFGRDNLNSYGQSIFDTWPERDQLRLLWNQLSAVRNALDHAGYQEGAMGVEKIVRKVNEDIMPQLETLASAWGMRE